MKNIFSFGYKLLLFTLFASNFQALCALAQNTPSHHILVSVAPHKFFVEKIAGSTATVDLLVPAGASAHTYEPSPKQMLSASQADIWFRIGEPFEDRAIKALQSHNSRLIIVDLRKGIDLIIPDSHGNHHHCCSSHAFDPHFWLSARLAKIQASTIAEALATTYPEHKDLYKANLEKFHIELDQLDQEISELLKTLKNRTIMVSHPAYGYFCRDYNLNQLSIEFEGRDPTPQVLTQTLTLARKLNIRYIYIQKQYNNKGAKLIAQEIGASTIMLDPYSENYISSMLEIARAFAEN